MLNKQAGFSMIEVLVMLVLTAIVGSMSAGFIVNSKKQNSVRTMRSLQDNYVEIVGGVLSLGSTCKDILPTSGQYSLGGGTLTVFSYVAKSLFNSRLEDPIFEVSEARIIYSPVRNVETAQAYRDQSYLRDSITGDREILATLTLTLGFRSDKPWLLEQYSNLDKKQVSFNLKMTDEKSITGTRQWSGVTCANEDAEETIFKSQICSIYGGTLVDGGNCDFSKLARNHAIDSGGGIRLPENVPVQKVVQGTANRLTRVRLSEVICYLDTLMLFTETLPSITAPPRNRTFYCRFPGGSTWSTRSTEVRRFFDVN